MRKSFDTWPKHFLYLSPTKVDALFGQIEQGAIKRIAKKLTVDLKVLKAELSSGTPEQTIYARLKVVLTYLDRQSLIGSVDQPGQYFAGSMLMRSGPFLRCGEKADNAKLVYFGGATAETIVGLGGSREHVFGNVGSAVADSHSSTPSILRTLQKDLGQPLWYKIEEYRENDEDQALTAVEVASSEMEGPLQKVEFVAKRLLWGDAKGFWGLRGSKTLLGSPIYVALDD